MLLDQLFEKITLAIPHLDENTINAQAIGNIANAMARRLPQWRPGVMAGEELARDLTTQERRVFECLAGYAAGIPDGGFDAQSMTLLVNAFARANIKDSELFSRIAGVARRLDTDSQFDAQVNLLQIRWAAPTLFHVGNHKICRIVFTTVQK